MSTHNNVRVVKDNHSVAISLILFEGAEVGGVSVLYLHDCYEHSKKILIIRYTSINIK